jgi:Flp pilus assembly protein TadD
LSQWSGISDGLLLHWNWKSPVAKSSNLIRHFWVWPQLVVLGTILAMSAPMLAQLSPSELRAQREQAAQQRATKAKAETTRQGRNRRASVPRHATVQKTKIEKLASERRAQEDFVVEPAFSAFGYVAAPLRAAQDARPDTDSMKLNEALTRLGRNPRDGQALIDAGQAALSIGDVDAAVGFFSRADQVSPGKAGLGRAQVHNCNPLEAIPQFDVAERAGALDSAAASDRGLASDLVADNVSAQRYYRQALAEGPNDEATRRLAISLAITGDKRGATAAISPLLSRQDNAAWRARAFSLAILGQADDAISVINGTLPPALASGIAPYMRYMPRLTPAQQAAAANFGQFPRASEIGQGDSYISNNPMTKMHTADAKFQTISSSTAADIGAPLRVAQDARHSCFGAGDEEFRQLYSSWRGLDERQARALSPRNLGLEQTPMPNNPAPTYRPSRIWVQLATARDQTELTFEWRHMARQAEEAFRNQRPSISAWGQTNRLLAGPFESEAAANAFVTKLRQSDFGGAFVWTSPTGQEVDALAVR